MEDFYAIFTQLDEGSVIETADMENLKIKQRLHKLFKVLKVRNKGTDDKPAFRKSQDENIPNLGRYVRGLFDELVNGKPYNDSNHESESKSEES